MANKALSKTDFINRLATTTNLPKKDVAQFLSHLCDVATDELKTNGVVSIPGLVKIAAVAKPATAERQGINPFTKAKITIAAKPASTRVKASPATALKTAVI